MADKYEEMARQMRADGVSEEMIARFVAEEMEEDGFSRGKGVTEIEAKTFDPSLHNAVMHVEDETKGDGEIVEVFQKGYKKGDKVIRYAMVKSAN